MNAVYTVPAEDQQLFAEANSLFDELKAALVSPEWCALAEPELERRVSTNGKRVLLALLQSHVTLRGTYLAVGPVVGADGLARTHVRTDTTRMVESTLGRLAVPRATYSGRGLSTLHPTDAALNLPARKYSLELERVTALAAVKQSYLNAKKAVEDSTAAKVGKRTIESLVERVADDFAPFYAQRQWSEEATNQTGSILVMSFDGKGVVMREEDLSSATLRIAEARANRLQAIDNRDGKDHWKGRKKMAMVGVVHTIEPDQRSAAEIIAGLRRIRPVDARPTRTVRPESKRVWATLTDDPRSVVEEGFVEALKRDPERTKRWVVLIDGAPTLVRWVKAAARRHKVKITIGLDFIHALQYLWKAGEAFCVKDSAELQDWVLERLQHVLDGKASHVAAGIGRSATLRELSPAQRREVDRCRKYFLKRTKLMRYDILLAMGAPIATGVVEGACKHLIADRMDLSGAKWSLKGAEALLKLRAVYLSGDFDKFWSYHEAEEYRRNHASRFAHGRPNTTLKPSRATKPLHVVR